MESLSFTGIASSEHSGAKQIEDWITDIYETRRKRGEPRYWIIGIDYGFDKPKRIRVVIGH